MRRQDIKVGEEYHVQRGPKYGVAFRMTAVRVRPAKEYIAERSANGGPGWPYDWARNSKGYVVEMRAGDATYVVPTRCVLNTWEGHERAEEQKRVERELLHARRMRAHNRAVNALTDLDIEPAGRVRGKYVLLTVDEAIALGERLRGICETCHGEGAVETTIGGDGYGDRCAGLADVPIVCPDCEGTGKAMHQEEV